MTLDACLRRHDGYSMGSIGFQDMTCIGFIISSRSCNKGTWVHDDSCIKCNNVNIMRDSNVLCRKNSNIAKEKPFFCLLTLRIFAVFAANIRYIF